MDNKECEHLNARPSWEHVTCLDCGKVKTGDHKDKWGIAADKWFDSLVVAEFYKINGKLPEILT